ncbi:MAG: hypothetical protein AAGC55_22825, partial [Myxococcota bacterium]
MKYGTILSILLACAALAGCSDDEGASEAAPTYYSEAKAIIDARCVTCHSPGNIAPFSLTTYEEVTAYETLVRTAIESGTMPPWQPDDECNTYLYNIDLTSDEKSTLLAWLDADAPLGDPADAAEDAVETESTEFATDISLQLPEPYTPTREPDDYRCQLIPWPAEDTRFVTGLRVIPDQNAIVHHVIVFLAGPDQVAQYQAYDDAEEGPGYTCYGGPTGSGGAGGVLDGIDPAEVLAALEAVGITLADLQAGNVTAEQLAALLDELDLDMDSVGGFSSLGSWVPGAPAAPFPAGTGIKVEPGSMLVVQIHYNTNSSDPMPDQSAIEIATTDHVEREATRIRALDLGWVTDGMIGD